MTDTIPPRRRSLDSLKKEAKRWLHALRDNAAGARARLERILPGVTTHPTLRDVQHALALQSEGQMTDAVRRCHNLRRQGFAALADMPALRGLSVSCLNVDDIGVSALPAFPALKELMPMDVPDAGYRHIARCEQLEALILMYCRDTTDAATEHITGLPKLSYYFNSYTRITDRTPALLSEMDPLERITFDTCHGLTNAGIARLARLPRLRELRVSGRGLTSEVAGAFPARVSVFYPA